MTTVERLRRLAWRGIDAVLPPQCPLCRQVTMRHGGLCPACWRAAHFIAAPLCGRCGAPFDYDPGADMLCARCLTRPPAYDRARAVLRYDEASRRLVLGLKYGDRLDGAAAFAEWMARAGADVLAGADMIVPVPLHWTRLFARRYNQAAVLALALGRRCGVAVMPDALIRVRRTPQQAGLSQKARWRNVQGAFRLRPGLADRLAGRRIVLIDDVITTGATVEGCARALRRAGAGGVDVLSLARVVRPGQLPI